jgi:dTDP-4-dehydrorhamnose reductase
VLGHDRWSGSGVAPLPGWRTLLHEAMPVLLR